MKLSLNTHASQMLTWIPFDIKKWGVGVGEGEGGVVGVKFKISPFKISSMPYVLINEISVIKRSLLMVAETCIHVLVNEGGGGVGGLGRVSG